MAQFDLSRYPNTTAVVEDQGHWTLALGKLTAKERPPPQPAQPAAEARKNAGLPPTRRLSNAEYNYTIRDLTGVDIRPTRDFRADPAPGHRLQPVFFRRRGASGIARRLSESRKQRRRISPPQARSARSTWRRSGAPCGAGSPRHMACTWASGPISSLVSSTDGSKAGPLRGRRGTAGAFVRFFRPGGPPKNREPA
jgi:hypothetical protein